MSQTLAKRARDWVLDLRRYQRQEQMQGHISPTDSLFLTRLQDFLDKEVAPALEKVAADGKTANKG